MFNYRMRQEFECRWRPRRRIFRLVTEFRRKGAGGTKNILMSEILNVIQDFKGEELPQKNTKGTKKYSKRNCIQSSLCFLRFFVAIAF